MATALVSAVLLLSAAAATASQPPEEGRQASFIGHQASFVGHQASFVGHQVLRVSVTNNRTLNVLRRYQDVPGVDFWATPSALSGTADVMVSPEIQSNFTAQLNSSGASYTVSIGDIQVAVAEQRRHLPGPDRWQGSGRQGYRLTWHAYHRLADHHQYLDYVARNYPDLCESLSIGNSSEGKDLKVAKCGTGAREVWIDGGIHAREWIAPAVVSYLVKEFAENSNGSQDIMDEFTIYFLPVMNPDGYEYSHTGNRMWRKTRSTTSVHSCRGVDANRNFDIHWGTVGSSKNPCSSIYSGPRAFSEPETAAVKDFLLSHADNMEMYISFHSYSQMLFTPYAYGTARPSDYDELLRVAELGAEAVSGAGGPRYRVGQPSRLLYSASGSSQDWAKAVAGVKYSFTFELRDTGRHGFLLPASLIEQSGAEIFAGVQTMIRAIA